MTPRGRRWLGNGLLVFASILFSLAVVEGVIAYALAHPEILASADGRVGKAQMLARNYYMRKDRPIVQFRPDCAVYDAGVTYTLKPSARCVIEAREYAVEYAANRAGLRDDEEALDRPTIVFAGDSHGMGWGVAAAESFPKKVGANLGVKTLNTAISSYGTARELAMVERLNLGDFKALVIQYCENDFDENTYLVNVGRLDILPEAKYRALVEEHADDTGYYPGRYVRNLLSIARLAMPWRKPPPLAPDTNAMEARAFLEVLLRHLPLLQDKAVVVLELNEHNRNDTKFITALNLLLNEPRFAALKPLVSVVDASTVLTAQDYYLLDDHMRPSGHAKVATLIEGELKRRGVVAP